MALTLREMVASAHSRSREVSPVLAVEAANDAELDLIVDVREPAEYEDGHLPQAINIRAGYWSYGLILPLRWPTPR